jgi:hypothetical protein
MTTGQLKAMAVAAVGFIILVYVVAAGKLYQVRAAIRVAMESRVPQRPAGYDADLNGSLGACDAMYNALDIPTVSSPFRRTEFMSKQKNFGKNVPRSFRIAIHRGFADQH